MFCLGRPTNWTSLARWRRSRPTQASSSKPKFVSNRLMTLSVEPERALYGMWRTVEKKYRRCGSRCCLLRHAALILRKPATRPIAAQALCWNPPTGGGSLPWKWRRAKTLVMEPTADRERS